MPHMTNVYCNMEGGKLWLAQRKRDILWHAGHTQNTLTALK